MLTIFHLKSGDSKCYFISCMQRKNISGDQDNQEPFHNKESFYCETIELSISLLHFVPFGMATKCFDKLKINSVFKKKKVLCKCNLSRKKCFNQKIIVICFPRSIRDDQYFRLCCTGSSLTVRSWKTGSVGASIWTGFWIWIGFGSVSIAASICCRVCC